MNENSIETAGPADGEVIETKDLSKLPPPDDGLSKNTIEQIGDLNDLVGWMNVNFATRSLTQSLRIAAFVLCVDILAQDSAKAPMLLMETLNNSTAIPMAPDRHPIAGLLADRPNDVHTWYEFHWMFGFWQALLAQAHAVIIKNSLDEVVALAPISHGQQVPWVAEGKLWYSVTSMTQFQQLVLGTPYDFVPAERMIHSRTRMFDGFRSLSTLDVGKDTLDIAADIDRWRKDIMVEQGQMRGVFKRNKEGALNDGVYERLAETLRKMLNRYRAGQPVVLEDLLEFQPMSVKPSEAELVKQFEAQIIQVCRLLRIPPHKVFHLDNSKYDNLATLEESYIKDTLIPFLSTKEQAFTLRLLTPLDRRKGRFLQHDRQMLQLQDRKTETERFIESFKLGALTFDEFRGRVHQLPPLKNKEMGSATLIPTTYQVIGADGNILIGGAGTNPNDPNAPKPAAPAPKKEGSDAEISQDQRGRSAVADQGSGSQDGQGRNYH